MKNREFSAEISEAQNIYTTLNNEYQTLQDIAKIGKKYSNYLIILAIMLFVFFGIDLAGFYKPIPLFIAFLLLALFSLIAWKRNRYLLSSNQETFLNLCEGYEKLKAFLERRSELYLNGAFKSINSAYSNIARTMSARPSNWIPVLLFYEQLGILGETFRRKILANISSRETSDEQMQEILFEIIKLADVMKNPSTERIEKYVENLRANKNIPERELVTSSRRMIIALQQNRIIWGVLKGLSIFGFSALMVLGFGWLLCEIFELNLGDYVGYLIVGTITLFVAIYYKRG